MITIKSEHEIELMRIAGHIVYEAHQFIKPYIKEGITTEKLDKLVESFIISKGATASCKGYEGYPKAICISINEEVVHGIPGKRRLKNGDIVTLDICACYKGYHGDSAWTYAVGKIDDSKKNLMKWTEEALYKGLEQAKPGNRIGDISAAIEEYAHEHKLGVVKELTGHGIGSNLHEDPDVPNYGMKNTGPKLKPGMCIAIEPMLNLDTPNIYLLEDDWTIITQDYKPSAHFEHTIVITEDGYEILTKE